VALSSRGLLAVAMHLFILAMFGLAGLTEAEIYLSDVGAASLPAPIRSRLVRTSPNTNVLNLQRWAIEDLNVTPYPETRIYKGDRKKCARRSARSHATGPDRSRASPVVQQAGGRLPLR